MKTEYITPEVEITVFDTEDIIITSNPDPAQGGNSNALPFIPHVPNSQNTI